MTTFAQRIEMAANAFPGAHSTAWVQYSVGPDRTVKVRMQAPEIMKEFEGDVKFGYDPKGILFFRSMEDLDISTIRVQNKRYRVGQTSKYIAETEFGGLADPFTPFARFVAEVNTTIYTLPDFNDALGIGTMRAFDAVTSHAKAVRRNDATIYLESDSVHKQAYFTSDTQNSSFSRSGVMFFRVLAQLKNQPNGRDYCTADYNSDRIVFHVEGLPGSVVALFLPNEPITNIGTGKKRASWVDTPPPTRFMAIRAEPEDDADTSA